jgi:hypothetical protein
LWPGASGGSLFDRPGVTMSSGWQVRVPTRERAEHEFDPSGVACRHRAPIEDGARSDGLTTHGADTELRFGHGRTLSSARAHGKPSRSQRHLPPWIARSAPQPRSVESGRAARAWAGRCGQVGLQPQLELSERGRDLSPARDAGPVGDRAAHFDHREALAARPIRSADGYRPDSGCDVPGHSSRGDSGRGLRCVAPGGRRWNGEWGRRPDGNGIRPADVARRGLRRHRGAHVPPGAGVRGS